MEPRKILYQERGVNEKAPSLTQMRGMTISRGVGEGNVKNDRKIEFGAFGFTKRQSDQGEGGGGSLFSDKGVCAGQGQNVCTNTRKCPNLKQN